MSRLNRLLCQFAAATLLLPSAAAAQRVAVNEVHNLSGPRIGMTFIGGISSQRLRDEFGLSSFTSEFGWQFEQLIAPKPGGMHLIVRETILAAGIDNGTFVPSLNATVGFRQPRGLELSLGPSLSVFGTGVALTAGWNFVYGTTSIPVNVTYTKNGDATRLTIVGGFAIETMRRAGAVVD
jgi:hypothetical protein